MEVALIFFLDHTFSLSRNVLFLFLLRNEQCSGHVPQLVGGSSHTPEGWGFDPQSGHVPRSPVPRSGHVQESAD